MSLSRKHKIVFTPLLGIVLVLSITGWLHERQWGLMGEFYANAEWAGEPEIRRRDPSPILQEDRGYWVGSSSVFSARWKGWISIQRSGNYQFATKSDDGSFLRIDGQHVVDNGGTHGLKKISNTIYLEEGAHTIEVRYFEIGGLNILRTTWTPPGETEQFIPAQVLFVNKPAPADVFVRAIIVRLRPMLQVFWFCMGII